MLRTKAKILLILVYFIIKKKKKNQIEKNENFNHFQYIYTFIKTNYMIYN